MRGCCRWFDVCVLIKEQALQLHVRGEEEDDDEEDEEEEVPDKGEMSRLSGRSSSSLATCSVLAWFRDPQMLHRDERPSLWKVQS